MHRHSFSAGSSFRYPKIATPANYPADFDLQEADVLKALFLMSDAILLAACSVSSESERPPSANERTLAYRCQDGQVLELTYVPSGEGPESVRLMREDEALTLPRVIAASGERYSDGTFTWWGKGKNGVLMKGEAFLAKDCQLVE
ncbi:MliC family protein [Rhodovibrionaceae bacterium A322]